MTTLPELTARTPGLPCRIDPDPFFSDNALERAAAVRQCRTCPLQLECAAYAIEAREAHGVWGGTTSADRRSFWDGRPWRFDEQGRLRQVCGSVSAYHAHFTYREQPCEECTAAWDEQLLAERRRRLDEEHAKGGSAAGYHLHRRIGEPACEACLASMRAQSAAVRRRARRGRARSHDAPAAPAAPESVSGAPAGAQSLRAA
ncbi:WhiB family transcriptional regulator [Streptomyces sp. NPDC101149]|uniref:WhiB family transcriptional regulator n=1 Tax=Streptomyces sp. NPDC101149 TaxID=3366113 RepID=UPI0037FE83A8